MKCNCIGLIMLLLGFIAAGVRAQGSAVLPPPDPRMKADVLLIVAHPDDETAVAAYLAKAIHDLHKRVAIIYCNRGTGGGNSVGPEQGKSMGLIREIETRQAAARLGIDLVWVLNGRDTPSQDLFQSLQNWNHGAVLEDVVRIIRLTRPEVIFTWLPHFVAGENHGDHQAAGVIATEAFDCAGDPTVFPAQVAVPRERMDISNSNEGLHPWQAKKLYYFSDASHRIAGEGPAFDVSEVSPSLHIPYYKVAAAVQLPHKTQGDVSQEAESAAASGDYARLQEYLARFRLLFGKSIVPCASTGDVFEGITAGVAAFAPHPGYAPVKPTGVSLALGGAFAFYRCFWKVHGIERIASLVPYEMEIASGSYITIPLLLQNGTSEQIEVNLNARLPDGWELISGNGLYRIPPGDAVPVQAAVQCGRSEAPDAHTMTWDLVRQGKTVSSVSMSIHLLEWTLPQ